MKKSYLCAVALLSLVAVSCSDDDSGTGIVTVNPDPIEEIALNPDDVSGNIIINNGTIVAGDAPTPTGTLPFTMDQTTQSGFQKNGFDISFGAPTNYAGAYIQLQSSDGTMAAEYWNVTVPGRSNVINNNKRKGLFNKQLSKSNDQQVEIDVDFEDAVSPGTFCYLICIYDTEGNISQPVEVCVEVEAWAGNPNLVGTWNYTKQIINNQTFVLGDINFCEGPGTITCNNDSTLVVEENEGWCYASTEINLTLNADGTFTHKDLNFQKQEFDFSESTNSCSVVNNPVEDNFGSEESVKGMWAYDEEEAKLNLIVFEETSIYFEDDMVESYTEEFGYLFYLSGTTFVNGSELRIDSQDDGISLQTFYTK
ncbi:hypothetical protein [uncultured Aquimarina sp.]|uniref:hypothetical protein n=1 Tax=uncultured Aquimarina sp. TaxID=575652 RepID=UPI0026397ED9|nr:hypothetical protein [uncultured Aquimarina sp.]